MNTIKIEKGEVLLIAHRGLSGIEKENTNAAFVAAGNRSYFGVETDIRRTADGRFVVNHDKDLLRVAGECIPVEEVSLSTLQSIVLFDKDGTKDRADLRPCSLENYVSICKKYEKHCVIELKSAFTPEETQCLLNIIKAFDYLDHVTFISFKHQNLIQIRELLPQQSVQYLFTLVTEETVERAITHHFDVDVRYDSLTRENIRVFHEAGLKVNCWTVDSKEIAEELVDMGVDYISTNILE